MAAQPLAPRITAAGLPRRSGAVLERERHQFAGVVGELFDLGKGGLDLGAPEVPEFLDQIVAAGGHLWACRMSADMMKLTESDLRDDVEGIISAADFIELTNGAELLFI